MITMQQLKDLANSIEAKAKVEENLGVKSGMYQAISDIWLFINKEQVKTLS